MNALRKKSAVTKYGEAIKADLAAAEAQLAQDGYTPEEIAEVVEAVSTPQPNDPPAEAPPATKSKPAESKKPAKAKEDVKPGMLTFDKCQVEVIFELKKNGQRKLDQDGELIPPKFEKGKVLKEVKITQAAADILNQQSENTKIRYYLVEE